MGIETFVASSIFFDKGILMNEKNAPRHRELNISVLLNGEKTDIHVEKVEIEGMLQEKFSPSKQPCVFVNDCI